MSCAGCSSCCGRTGRRRGSGSPLPGLAQLVDDDQLGPRSGVAVTLEVSGEPRRLDTSVDLAAYRLVQEALTNVTKHRGAGAHATVSIEWGAEKVTVAVEDDGQRAPDQAARAPGSLSTGNGLAGLRERIAIAGGDFVGRADRTPVASGSPPGCRCPADRRHRPRGIPAQPTGGTSGASAVPSPESAPVEPSDRPATRLAWIDP